MLRITQLVSGQTSLLLENLPHFPRYCVSSEDWVLGFTRITDKNLVERKGTCWGLTGGDWHKGVQKVLAASALLSDSLAVRTNISMGFFRILV